MNEHDEALRKQTAFFRTAKGCGNPKLYAAL